MKQRINISRAELERRYTHEGQTLVMIAAEIGCSASTVSNMLRRNGISTRNGRFVGRPIPREQLFQLYSVERLPIKAIAAQFGVHCGTINNWRRTYGIPQRPRSRSLTRGEG